MKKIKILNLQPKIGLRSIKTVIAVFICCVLDFLRGVVPIQSTIAAILCVQPNTKNSIRVAITRAVGTLIGGIAAVLVLYLMEALNVLWHSILFYGLLCIFLIPLIYIPVKLRWPDATALTCIVYIVITMSNDGQDPAYMLAINRVIDTYLGILVSLSVNAVLPKHHADK